MQQDIYDFIGIGLGPFNLGLACLAEPIEGLNGIFLERNAEFNWHPGMLIDHTTLQNPFLADLVSLADPTSSFSFLNYCKTEGKIYSYYFRENFYLTRAEYNAYCRWAAARLSNVRFNHDVQDISYDAEDKCYIVTGTKHIGELPFIYRCKKLVLGVGSRPYFPACCEADRQRERNRYFHTADYLESKAQLQRKRSITIIGSGQSAAEVYYDLLKEIEVHDYQLIWITRSQRFFQMETTKLTLEMFSPDYIDYFYELDDQKKDRIVRSQDSLYKGVNASLINQIYDLLDDLRNKGRLNTRLITNCELQSCRYDAANEVYEIEFCQLDCEQRYAHRSEALIFGTGYCENIPPFIEGIRKRMRWDEKGRYRLARNYAADIHGSEIFIQNAGQHTHGMTNQDLGMSCYRNSFILRELSGKEHYKIEKKIAIQDFSVPCTQDFIRL